MHRAKRLRGRRWLVSAHALTAVGLLLAIAACSPAGPFVSGRAAPAVASASAAAPLPSPSPSMTRAPVARHLSPPVAPGVTWVPAGDPVHGIQATYVARVDGGAVSLLWMDPTLLRFRYVPGTKFPGGPTQVIDSRPSTWVPEMVAAFNGGFELKDSAGGYYYAGSLVRPLRPGLAAMQITGDGRLRVGVWGRDLSLSPTTTLVRENLRPLVDLHVSQASPTDSVSAWGRANGSLVHANRSALAQLDDGALVFAYGHEVRAWQLADALVAVRAAEAVMLDMNKSWPGGFTYTHAGKGPTGRKINPLMYHNGSIYLTRFTKDFVVALAANG